MRIVKVTWLDAISGKHGWKDKEDVLKQKPAKCVSYGQLVVDEPDYITLIAHETDDGDCDGDVTLPRGMIVEIETLQQ